MGKKQQAIALREIGYTYEEIGKALGCSRQYICQLIGKGNPQRFQYIKKEDCAYPKLAEWMNKNKVSRSEFVRRMGLQSLPENIIRFSRILRGEIELKKKEIDRMLKITGMTYEELFGVI